MNEIKIGTDVLTTILNREGTVDKIAYRENGSVFMYHIRFKKWFVPNEWEYPEMITIIK